MPVLKLQVGCDHIILTHVLRFLFKWYLICLKCPRFQPTLSVNKFRTTYKWLLLRIMTESTWMCSSSTLICQQTGTHISMHLYRWKLCDQNKAYIQFYCTLKDYHPTLHTNCTSALLEFKWILIIEMPDKRGRDNQGSIVPTRTAIWKYQYCINRIRSNPRKMVSFSNCCKQRMGNSLLSGCSPVHQLAWVFRLSVSNITLPTFLLDQDSI